MIIGYGLFIFGMNIIYLSIIIKQQQMCNTNNILGPQKKK